MSDPKTAMAEAIEQDHARLKRLMTALADAAAGDVAPWSFSNWKLDLLLQLRDFQGQLLKHFDLEEAGGFMAGILSVAPHQARQVEQLEAEHRRILADLDGLLAALKQAEDAPAAFLPEGRRRLGALLALIRAHEAAECALIQEVYYQDYGVKD